MSNSDQAGRKGKTQWHHLLAKMLEESLTRLQISVQTDVAVVSQPPEADIILLRREGKAWTDEQKAWLADGLRDTTARELLIEFKFTESLSENAIEQTISYSYFYRTKHKLNHDALQSFLLIAKTPNTDILERFGYEKTVLSGVYVSRYPLIHSVQIVLLNQLTDEPHNAVVKCFASKEQEWRKGFATLNHHVWHGKSKEFDWITIGLGRVRMNKSVEDMDIGWTPENLMDFGKELFESVMNHISSEELLKFSKVMEIRQQGAQKGIMVMLLDQLEQRFHQVPDWVVSKVQTADTALLRAWSKRIIHANSIEDIFV